MPELFEPGQPGTEDQGKKLIAQLHQKITGQLTVDLDWLKKVQTTGVVNMSARAGQPGIRRSVCGISANCWSSAAAATITSVLRRRRRTAGVDAWQLDELHLEHPVYGTVASLTVLLLHQQGLAVNRKRVVRLLRLMGIEAIYAKPRTSLPEPGHQIYPYLLRDLAVTGPDQVW